MRRRMPQHEGLEHEGLEPNLDQGGSDMARQSDFRHGGQSAGMRATGAGRGGSMREMGGVGFLLRNAQDVNLTEAQQENLSKLQTPFELEKVDKLAALSKAKIIFRALAGDHSAAERDVLNAIDKVAACEADLRKMRYYHLKAARTQLDANQLDGLLKMRRSVCAAKVEAATPNDCSDGAEA